MPTDIRLRRNRRTPAIRDMVQETRLHPSDFVVPLFVIEGTNLAVPIASMPGIHRFTVDSLLKKIEHLAELGIQSVALFPAIESSLRTDGAEEAWNPNGLIPRAIRAVKQHFPHVCVISDIALDPYTSHGHDGLANAQGDVLNDETVEALCRMACVHAEAGIDLVAPSDMMDGRVRAIRQVLDAEGHTHVGILAYSAKYASALYGPFRDALQTKLAFGDKKTYQMNPANVREALLEAQLDEDEGADILLVKPALFYLDVIARLREQTQRPIAAYHVSGEYSMVMAAAAAGYLNAEAVFQEALLSIKRAGADLIFTYAAETVLSRM